MKKAIFTMLCLAAMLTVGTSLMAQEFSITLDPGWNWISNPNMVTMELNEALVNFTPMEGDRIQSISNSSSYSNGSWRGGFTCFAPGCGYMYYSARTENIDLVFPQVSSPVATATPTNLTAISAVAGGTVDLPEGSHVFQRGVCWNTTPNPNVDNFLTLNGTGIGSFSGTIEGLSPSTTYYIRAYAVSDTGLAYGEEIVFTTPDYPYVDLGLPSGLLWATYNVGADQIYKYGDYFAWGETQPKDTYTWATYQLCNGNDHSMTKYCTNASFGHYDNLTILQPGDDAATANWGGPWRTPTKEEWMELYMYTTVRWVTRNGVYGRSFTASNGNSIFLPAAGNISDGTLLDAGSKGSYWSRSLTAFYPSRAWLFGFSSSSYSVDYGNRSLGKTVRAVRPAL